MRVVLDTNVLIAAFISRGACAQLFEAIVTTHEAVSSEGLLQEFHNKLTTKFRFSQSDADEALALLKLKAQLVTPVALQQPVCRDPDDDLVLATAATGDAQCIITGDKDLLILKQFQGIDIIRPADFMAYESAHV